MRRAQSIVGEAVTASVGVVVLDQLPAGDRAMVGVDEPDQAEPALLLIGQPEM
jgi:hypothetical protein